MAGRVARAIQEGQQSGGEFPLVWMPGKVRLGGRADVGRGERYVINLGAVGEWQGTFAAHAGGSRFTPSSSEVIW